jgi:hypothetical protein
MLVLVVIDDADDEVVWAEHSLSLSQLCSIATRYICHPEEDSSVYVDGLWDTWHANHDGQVVASRRGYTVWIYDEHVIQLRHKS